MIEVIHLLFVISIFLLILILCEPVAIWLELKSEEWLKDFKNKIRLSDTKGN